MNPWCFWYFLLLWNHQIHREQLCDLNGLEEDTAVILALSVSAGIIVNSMQQGNFKEIATKLGVTGEAQQKYLNKRPKSQNGFVCFLHFWWSSLNTGASVWSFVKFGRTYIWTKAKGNHKRCGITSNSRKSDEEVLHMRLRSYKHGYLEQNRTAAKSITRLGDRNCFTKSPPVSQANFAFYSRTPAMVDPFSTAFHDIGALPWSGMTVTG